MFESMLDKSQLSDYKNDYQIVCDFLSKYQNTHATLSNYNKETKRFLFFIYVVKKNTLLESNELTITEYLSFLNNPPKEMLGHKLSVSSTEWKPLNKPLKQSSIKLAKRILMVFYTHLMKSKLISDNPFENMPKIRTDSAASSSSIIESSSKRYFSRKVLKKCLTAIDALHEQYKHKPHKVELFSRYRFILAFLYLTMMRISEFASIRSDNFKIQDYDTDKESYWYIAVVGKGSSSRNIPISPTLRDYIESYLDMTVEQFALSKNGINYESLLKPLRGNSPLAVAALSSVVKMMFIEISDYIETNMKDIQTANLVKTASAHWLRHTGGSHMLGNGVDMTKARDLLGHSNVSTTNNYLHSDSDYALNDAISTLKI